MQQDALRTELERHHAESYGWALSCCGQDADRAADVLQTAYLKVLEGRARFHGQSAFRTWLFAVIRNTAADARRQRRRLRLRLARFALLAPPEATAPPPDPDAARRTARFRALLARLPDRQREVLHLVFYHDLTLVEAAAVMGVSPGAARQHYARGKARLRQWLDATDDASTRRLHPQGLVP